MFDLFGMIREKGLNMKNVKVIYKEKVFENYDGLYGILIDNKEHHIWFEKEHEAYIGVGLLLSGISLNDCSYMGKYINGMISKIIESN